MTSRTRRVWRLALVAVVVLLVAATVSIDFGRTLRVIDMSGQRVPDVVVVHHREGSNFNLVHPTTYQASEREALQSGEDGLVRIGPSVDVHLPFPLQSAPSLVVDFIYAPSLHNAWPTIHGSAVSMAGVFAVDADLSTVHLADLSADPERWVGTMQNLQSMIGRLTVGSDFEAPASDSAASVRRLLIDLFVREYGEFLERHRDVARIRPVMPDFVRQSTAEERKGWEDMIERDYTERPTWGELLTSIYADDVKRLTRNAPSPE